MNYTNDFKMGLVITLGFISLLAFIVLVIYFDNKTQSFSKKILQRSVEE